MLLDDDKENLLQKHMGFFDGGGLECRHKENEDYIVIEAKKFI